MWPTIDGLRILKDAEASLVGRSIGVMVHRLGAEIGDDLEVEPYGIDWFDQWDSDQRVWLLEQVTVALLTHAAPPPPAAIWEATIDAIFCQVHELISAEIDEPSPLTIHDSWRQRGIDAFRCQTGRLPSVDLAETDLRSWRTMLTQIADAILGVTCYQQAEFFRDGNIERSRRFLMQKGLPADFLERIPPLRTIEQTQDSIARIESIVAEPEH